MNTHMIELYQDAYGPAEFESHNFLNHTELNQFRRQDIYSPPITPITSPERHQNSVTSQWVSHQSQVDTLSDTDSMDREVAATTANLALSSPRQSPYTQPKKSSSSSVGSSTTHSQQQKKKKRKENSTRALERLQTEVTALTEQMDRLRRNSLIEANNRKDRKGWIFKNLCLLLVKHLMVNSAILFIAFYILYKRKSPLAYAVMNYITPWMQQIIRNIIRRIVFWKVTV